MKLTLTIDSIHYSVAFDNARHLSIPLHFNGEQPNHFGAEFATAKPLEGGGFIGDTTQGGSCNVKQLHLVPHCNGTHTESISHIVNESVAIGSIAQSLFPTTVISITPRRKQSAGEDIYRPQLENSDSVITRSDLETLLSNKPSEFYTAIVVRTLPNTSNKQSACYNDNNQPPFFTVDAMNYLVELNVQHLLVDFPSIDKMYDEGKLTNHHLFWNVKENTHSLHEQSWLQKSITELIYVDDSINDGHYLLSLQVPDFNSDAAPSRPILYPLEKMS